jgi:hypothetical protein
LRPLLIGDGQLRQDLARRHGGNSGDLFGHFKVLRA